MGLAGIKKKQRITVDPQNKTWKEGTTFYCGQGLYLWHSVLCTAVIDKTKFGYKMLMKMGWEEGKGLGANEDGSTENLNLAYKSDTVGIYFPGYPPRNTHQLLCGLGFRFGSDKKVGSRGNLPTTSLLRCRPQEGCLGRCGRGAHNGRGSE